MGTTQVIEWEQSTPQVCMQSVPDIVVAWDDPQADDEKVELVAPVAQAPLLSKALEAEIQAAQKIAELEDDWDGEGSPAYSSNVVDRAVRFVTRYAETLWRANGTRCPIPRIGPGPNGSIDIHWKQVRWELLVNIPADVRSAATFYGDNYGIQTIKGSFDPEKFNLGIAEWLKS